MNIYKIYQTENQNYDTYDECVVCAIDEDDAKSIHPSGNDLKDCEYHRDWLSDKSLIFCKYIGIADPSIKRGVICASFNAG
jgi:hypothetical protein